MNRRPERHNAKARQSVAGGRSHKKGKLRNKNSEQDHEAAEPVDANAAVLARKSAEEKERNRRERLRQEVCAFVMPAHKGTH